MHAIEFYRQLFSDFLEKRERNKAPKQLYDPIDYILNLGGKRIRPVLTLMATDFFGGTIEEALPAAMAIEVFHNFSLVHDDIMDNAPLRRGKTTVHEKWDVNTAILSGDAMLIQAYQFLEPYSGATHQQLFKLFNATALQVCEGQQYDVDFEQRSDVKIEEYLKMIAYKTSVLLATALKMGGIIAQAPQQDQESIFEFGYQLGIAFQLQDDYLDAFGDANNFGKQVGGDIIENKKTYLYLKAKELANTKDKEALEKLFNHQPENTLQKITEVKRIFEHSGAAEATRQAVIRYTDKAFGSLSKISAPHENKALLENFGKQLMHRIF